MTAANRSPAAGRAGARGRGANRSAAPARPAARARDADPRFARRRARGRFALAKRHPQRRAGHFIRRPAAARPGPGELAPTPTPPSQYGRRYVGSLLTLRDTLFPLYFRCG